MADIKSDVEEVWSQEGCDACEGTGIRQYPTSIPGAFNQDICRACNGAGHIKVPKMEGTVVKDAGECPNCEGTGEGKPKGLEADWVVEDDPIQPVKTETEITLWVILWEIGKWTDRFSKGPEGPTTFHQGKTDAAQEIKEIIQKGMSEKHVTDALVKRFAEVLEQNKQLQARFNEQCELIEKKREEIQKLKDGIIIIDDVISDEKLSELKSKEKREEIQKWWNKNKTNPLFHSENIRNFRFTTEVFPDVMPTLNTDNSKCCVDGCEKLGVFYHIREKWWKCEEHGQEVHAEFKHVGCLQCGREYDAELEHYSCPTCDSQSCTDCAGRCGCEVESDG